MSVPILQYRNIVVTQGGADAFVQVTEPTGIDADRGMGWMIDRVEVMFGNDIALQNVSADFSISWSLTRDSETAIVSLDEASAIFAGGIAGSLTTSGQILLPRVHTWIAPQGIVVVNPNLYAQLDSDATGLTLSADFRIYYSSVKLSELEILRMLSQG